jgi:hypothetical protein
MQSQVLFGINVREKQQAQALFRFKSTPFP